MTVPLAQPAFPPFNRLVRKEVSLGSIREMLPPTDHIGLDQIAPFMDVETDDVIFDYIKGGLSEGLAPARAEDAEAELSQKDENASVQGRASIIDWSLKDKYTPSDVTRFRDNLLIQERLEGVNGLSVARGFVDSTTADFTRRVARHDALRRRKLDNRIEWLIMTALETGKIAYNDGKIKFTVDYQRPVNQQDQAPASGVLWDQLTADPINDTLAVNQYMWDTYKITLDHAYISRRILHSFWKASKFASAFVPIVGGTPSSAIDVNYLSTGFGPQAALAILEQSTGVKFTVYDSVYRTRALNTNTWSNNRFTSDNKVIFMPSEEQLAQIDDTEIGFAKTLTAPHPEGNWTSGYYEWEDETKDPWMNIRGTGIKAFPVFPFMQYSYVMQVLN